VKQSLELQRRGGEVQGVEITRSAFAPLLLSWVCRSFEDMRTNQQERGDFAVAWHPFSLPGRWAWFERAFKHKTCGTQRVEIGTEHAVMVSDPATYSVRVR
jgi:hypothetical protein